MVSSLLLLATVVTAPCAATTLAVLSDVRQTGRSELFPGSTLVWSDVPGRYQSSHRSQITADGVLQDTGRFTWDIGPRNQFTFGATLTAWRSDDFNVSGGMIDTVSFRVSHPTAFRLTATMISDFAELAAVIIRCPGSVSAIASPSVDASGRIVVRSSVAGSSLQASGQLAAGDYEVFVVSGIGSVEVDWLLELPRCPADFNQSFEVTVQDIFEFLGSYFAGEFRADFNSSMTLTVQDIFDFLAAYFQAC